LETPNCTFVEADAYNIEKVVPQPVDHVFLANAFHGVPDKPRLARAVHNVLKPGGLFAIVSWYARPREETTVLGDPRGPTTELRMTPEQTIAVVEPGGLKFRNRVDVSPYHYGAVFERPR
jgi:ubiquinone/menaquinone biosynthesis C-methylase UbiE